MKILPNRFTVFARQILFVACVAIFSIVPVSSAEASLGEFAGTLTDSLNEPHLDGSEEVRVATKTKRMSRIRHYDPVRHYEFQKTYKVIKFNPELTEHEQLEIHMVPEAKKPYRDPYWRKITPVLRNPEIPPFIPPHRIPPFHDSSILTENSDNACCPVGDIHCRREKQKAENHGWKKGCQIRRFFVQQKDEN